MPTCVVCDDRGCEHCPRVYSRQLETALGPTLETEMALAAVRGSVAFALDNHADLERIRHDVELAVSEWCDEQGEPPC